MAVQVQLEEARLAFEKKSAIEAHRKVDEAPLDEMRNALLSAQDDLHSKAEEASLLASKVARLESALKLAM